MNWSQNLRAACCPVDFEKAAFRMRGLGPGALHRDFFGILILNPFGKVSNWQCLGVHHCSSWFINNNLPLKPHLHQVRHLRLDQWSMHNNPNLLHLGPDTTFVSNWDGKKSSEDIETWRNGSIAPDCRVTQYHTIPTIPVFFRRLKVS